MDLELNDEAVKTTGAADAAARALAGTDGVRVASVMAPGAGAGVRVPVRIYQADGAPRGWLVWAHGGSWTAGSAAGWHHATADLARAASATVVSVDYRLAPEHPHPAALLDVLAAMDLALALTDGPISVGGDSAGATLAAAAALAWRDLGRPRLAAQVLAYPPIDPAARAASYHRAPHAHPSRAGLMAAWRAYRGTGERHPALTHATPWYSTPAEADDLGGLAPAILAVGTADPVADDVRGYARRLREAGNAVTFREFAGARHGVFLVEPGMRRWLAATYALTYERSTS
ncbi:alpha/beta hydrolase fold domain-containing protein [Spirillospora sp. NPDC047279]|uniref:alpha/beta hydrolase fold domain-containing protein n=1 Tax=Spirillospora sp. NPDC047279 TaxID=3155478 RepID=UPI0033D1CF81